MEELDLKELFNMFWSRKLVIILITAVFIVAGIIYTYMFVTPDYQSKTTVILAQSGTKTSSTSPEQQETTITASDLTLNQKLVSTYSELIKSKNILGEVIQHLKLKLTEDQLKSRITVSTVKDTELIQIRVTDPDPKQAKEIAEEIADVFIDKVVDGFYNIKNVQVWDKAEIDNKPYNINHKKDVIIFALAGMVVSAVYVLIANMLDTTVKNKEDIESKIGMPVLTTIPICNFESSLKTTRGGRR